MKQYPDWLPCKMILTNGSRRRPNNPRRANVNGLIRVRCKCMAEVECKDSYYGYDWLAEVETLVEACDTWKRHRESKAQRDDSGWRENRPAAFPLGWGTQRYHGR